MTFITLYFGIGFIVTMCIWTKPKGRYPYRGFGMRVMLWPLSLFIHIHTCLEKNRINQSKRESIDGNPNQPLSTSSDQTTSQNTIHSAPHNIGSFGPPPTQPQTQTTVSKGVNQQVTPICPICRTKMKLRTSEYGDFWGCSSFPKCKGKRKI
jgi:Topoisomerase DNA binding C4 zinc finger